MRVSVPAAATALLLASSCGADDRAARWRIQFFDPSHEDRVARVVAWIVEGGCDGSGQLYRAEVGPDERGMRPPPLRDGTYGFAAEARDDLCRTFARRCMDVTLPLAGDDPVTLTLDPIAEGAACEAACDVGRCVDAEPDPRRIFYISTTGDDTGPGSHAEPWGTFAHAIAQLRPSHALVLLDGEYDAASTGMIDVDCADTATDGSEEAPIRVVAANERRASLRADGQAAAVRAVDCDHWSFEGLRMESRDREGVGPNDGDVVTILRSSDVVLRRALVSRHNRMAESHVVYVYQSSGVTIEEVEAYFFSDDAIRLQSTADSVVRRSYVHSRDYPSISTGDALYPDGVATVDGISSDGGHVFMYNATNCVIENTVAEETTGFGMYESSRGNVYAGNVALDSFYGFVASHNDGVSAGDTLYVNNVVVRPRTSGYYIRGQENARVQNGTVIGGLASGFRADDPYVPPAVDGFFCTGCLSTANAGTGFHVENQTEWEVRRSTTYMDGDDYLSPDGVLEPVDLPPELGGCLVYLPSTSPLVGAGVDGADVGANVLFRYHDGTVTDRPLWTREGRFPCFAIVEGVNDDPSTSCVGVHERLDAGTADCPFPEVLTWP